MSTPVIAARDVEVRFRPYMDKNPTLRKTLARLRHRERGEVVALGGVSFDVHNGEAFGIIGENGAGKSTLLRVIAGTLLPDGGSVTVNGKTSTLLQLGVGFNPELSGRRNVYLGGLAAGLKKAEIDDRFDDIVAYAEVEDAIDRPLKTFSSGMFARLAFSISMHLDPDILLLDEVLAVGDEAFQQKSMRAMNELLDRSGTIVFVSHSLPKVQEFCDRVMWVDEGKVKLIGSPEEVIFEYRRSTGAAAASRHETKTAAAAAQLDPLARQWWTPEEKAQFVMRMIEGEDPAELAVELGIEKQRLLNWRHLFIQAGTEEMRAKYGRKDGTEANSEKASSA